MLRWCCVSPPSGEVRSSGPPHGACSRGTVCKSPLANRRAGDPCHDDPRRHAKTMMNAAECQAGAPAFTRQGMDPKPTRNLGPAIRASLNAKLERLLSRPIIAQVVGTGGGGDDVDTRRLPEVLRALQERARQFRPASLDAWHEDSEDGTCSVRVCIDYDDKWRGCEKEIQQAVANCVEGAITCLTEHQKVLLERSPREFLALSPSPETAELHSFETDGTRVVGLKLTAAPESRAHIRYVAIVPNLVQIERQLDALREVEAAPDDGHLGPLRALIGACDAAGLRAERPIDVPLDGGQGERLDEYQRECMRKALATPHFSVIEGPPGSGKTTVITAIIRRALARGDRVLVVSPTHVAVDNVVEKLIVPPGAAPDLLAAHTLPVRYAARPKKLSAKAVEYWVGAKRQRRGAAIAQRVRSRLCEVIPFAKALFEKEDPDASGHAPLSAAISHVESVVCGTPIGVLSYDVVKAASPGTFGVLIVDEVSKMTLPEFLAIAVKARRWVVVGDPAQLPPYNNAEENGATLEDVVPAEVELACSAAALQAARDNGRILVVASEPAHAATTIRAHLRSVLPRGAPSVGPLDAPRAPRIVVAATSDSDAATDLLTTTTPSQGVRVMVERGITAPRPDIASGARLVEPKERAFAVIFDQAFNAYHAEPWARRSGQRLNGSKYGEQLRRCAPSLAALDAVLPQNVSLDDAVRTLTQAITERFAINTVSVYDWLTGIPLVDFETPPLRDLCALSSPDLRDAIRPFVGTLKKQYRMHGSLSRVPRQLFYFNEALLDGRTDEHAGCCVTLCQVTPNSDENESNCAEVEAICELLEELDRDKPTRARRPEIMVITPYSAQESHLGQAIDEHRQRGLLVDLDIEVCTLDRCQGREAEYVLISLVKSRATSFLDMPKRWNVALTRAKEGLFIVGNIEAYVRAAASARRECARTRSSRPSMSALARIIEAYSEQIRAGALRHAAGVER